MNFAAIDWLSISINLLLVIFVIVCLLMTLLILMQRPKQEGLGAAFGAGVTDQVFGARTTNVLQRGTVYLGSMFFILALTLAVLIGHKNKKTSMLKSETPAAKVEEAKPADNEGANKPKSLTEELPEDLTPAPDAPAVPTPVEPTDAEKATPLPPGDELMPQPPSDSAPADLPPAGDPAAPADAPKPADDSAPADAPIPPEAAAPADASGTPEEKSGEP